MGEVIIKLCKSCMSLIDKPTALTPKEFEQLSKCRCSKHKIQLNSKRGGTKEARL